MRLFFRFALVAALAAPLAAQQSVIETRVFNNEVFDGLEPTGFTLDLGLQSLSQPGDGDVVSVNIQTQVRFEFEVEYINSTQQPSGLSFFNVIIGLPNQGDCSAYSFDNLGGSSPPIAPGDMGVLEIDQTLPFNFSGSSFMPACHASTWQWQDHFVMTDPFFYCAQYSLSGGVVPSHVVTLSGKATVSGHMTVEWIPNEIAHLSICDGNSINPTTLTPAGDGERLWLLQTGVPQDFNLLVQSPTATSIVPPNGLCITGGGGSFNRITESLSIGGEPFRFEYDPTLAGTVHYFQAWFRDGVNGPQTGECIGVVIP